MAPPSLFHDSNESQNNARGDKYDALCKHGYADLIQRIGDEFPKSKSPHISKLW